MNSKTPISEKPSSRDGLAEGIRRLSAYVETHKNAQVDNIGKRGHAVRGPAPDRISGHADGTELLLSDLVALLDAVTAAANLLDMWERQNLIDNTAAMDMQRALGAITDEQWNAEVRAASVYAPEPSTCPARPGSWPNSPCALPADGHERHETAGGDTFYTKDRP